ncbi:MAG TPA: helical backbone metal receptor [Planctomycetota bacterium]
MSRRFWILSLLVGGALVASALLRRSRPAPEALAGVAARVVSLAPSTTEVICALGLVDRLVGVCEFCEYPPEARAKPRMGGYYTPNFEVLSETRPDLVVVLPEHGPILDRLRDLRLPVLEVDHRTVAGILDSFLAVSRACGVPERGVALRAELEARLAKIKEAAKGRRRPRVLISVGRAMNEGSALRIATCGRGGFYDELLEMVGAENAYEGRVPYPSLSPEGVLALKPDVILEIMPDLKEKGVSEEGLLKDWAAIPGVAGMRVKVIARDYAVIPGPRFVRLLEDLAEAVRLD